MQIGQAIALKAAELYLKGGNRPAFVKVLLDNVRRMVAQHFVGIEVAGRAGRFTVVGGGHDPQLVALLRRVFGVSLVEEVYSIAPDPELLMNASVEVMRRHTTPTSTFKVQAKRTWKKFPMRSLQINEAVGGIIGKELGLKVNLGAPDVTLRIRVDADAAYLSVAAHPGAGGLPVGSSGKGLLLLSGGIDSPVAGWLAMRRGIRIECLHFHAPPYTGEALVRKVQDLVAVLSRFDPSIVLHLAEFTKAQEFVKGKAKEDYRVVLYRWLMMKTASRLGQARGADAIITGENLGQVASQTIQNMAVVEKAASLPVIRPLVAWNKAETVRLASEIGTFDISIRRAEDCCSLFLPRHPTTRANLNVCLEFDALPQVEEIVQGCLAGVRSFQD